MIEVGKKFLNCTAFFKPDLDYVCDVNLYTRLMPCLHLEKKE